MQATSANLKQLPLWHSLQLDLIVGLGTGALEP